jgi:hypothetical protein
MIGIKVQVTFAPGDVAVVSVTPRAAVNFERHFGIGIAKAFTEEQRMEHVYFLGWECSRTTRKLGSFEDWLDDVVNVEFVFDEEAAPLDPTPSST